MTSNTNPLDRLAAAVSGRYRIERELGRGGMATVYLARDLKHERSVALKVLHPDLAVALGSERFLHEVQVTARLQHPHILPLLDSGEANGLVYYVMPYVEGESLRDKLRRVKQLPVDEAIQITRQVALALDYAHRQGVVHRDIKPENILLSDNQPLVADFGLARAVEAAAGERLTETGLSVGTPLYMSPEQAAGERDLDGRTDIYSIGCVLFEMLVGEAPFGGPSARAIAARHSFEPIPSIRLVRPTVSLEVERIVNRAMAKVPADRFTSAAGFAEALASPAGISRRHSRRRWMLAAGAALGVAAAVAAVVFRARSAPVRPIASIAVLPPTSAGSDTAIDYLGDGLTETLINSLAANPNLRVAARSAVARYKGKSADPAGIGRDLGVQAVLTWTLRRRGERLNIQAELVKVADGSRLWGEQYDRPTSDILDVQERIATSVSKRLTLKPSAAQTQALTRRPTTNPEAYDFYTRARYLMHRRTGSWAPDTAAVEMAREYYEQALAKDPNFALAWSGLGDYYARKADGGDHPQENWAKAETLVRRALAIDSTSGDAWAALAIVLDNHHHDFDAAGRAYERAIRLSPTHPEAHWLYGERLLLLRRFDEAIRHMQEAVDLDPVDFMSNAKLGWALLVARRYDASIAQNQKLHQLAPTDFGPLKLLGFAYERKGMYPEAVSATQKSLLFEGDTAQATRLVKAYAARGVQGYWEVRRAALLEELAALNQGARNGDVDTTELIWVHAQLGDRDRAFALLRTISDPAELRDILWIWLVDSLRSDPRFGELVRKAGLPLMEGER